MNHPCEQCGTENPLPNDSYKIKCLCGNEYEALDQTKNMIESEIKRIDTFTDFEQSEIVEAQEEFLDDEFAVAGDVTNASQINENPIPQTQESKKIDRIINKTLSDPNELPDSMAYDPFELNPSSTPQKANNNKAIKIDDVPIQIINRLNLKSVNRYLGPEKNIKIVFKNIKEKESLTQILEKMGQNFSLLQPEIARIENLFNKDELEWTLIGISQCFFEEVEYQCLCLNIKTSQL